MSKDMASGWHKHGFAAAISSHFGAMSEQNEVEVKDFDGVFTQHHDTKSALKTHYS